MNDPFFFGYGSLVNQRTHDYTGLAPARISGWRRVWQPSPLRKVAYLTAVPDPAGQIHGVIAAVPGHDWDALDLRERAYARHALSPENIDHPLPTSPEIHVYAVETANPPNAAQPILLSYLDVVIQGYLAVYGEDGARNFASTTTGWDTPVMDDRAAPHYPRHQQLGKSERALVDDLLGCVNAELRPFREI